MRKLCYQCPHCEKDYLFDKTDLPAGFISPEDLDKNRVWLLRVDCPECNQSDIFSLVDIKKALEMPRLPEPPKGAWKWFWK